MLPEPYYERDGITIFNANCLDLLPAIEPATVALVLTDPPYGINMTFGGVGRTTLVNEMVYGDHEPFEPTPLLAFPRLILFGANHYANRLPSSSGWIVWDKVTTNAVISVLSDAEMAWTNVMQKTRVYRHMWNGAFRDSERGFSVHPTQKPVALMRWILERWSEPGDLILDPYMGSGPIARACLDLGRRYIGIELEERYCNIAVRRLQQQVMVFA